MSFEEQPTRSRAKKKKRTGRVVLLSILSLVVIAALVAVGYAWNLGRTFDDNSQKLENAFPA